MSDSVVGEMRVMSYNIKYDKGDNGEHSWAKRKEDLTALLKFYGPDIMGLQEVTLGQLKYVEENLPEYNYIGVARDDGKEKGEFSPIFYHSENFYLVEEGTFWLSETPNEPSKGWDAAYPRICTFALLQNRDSEEEFWVFNTHFDHKGEKAMEKSAELVLKKINELNEQQLPVILMGDLNSEPNSNSIRLLEKEMSDSREKAEKVVFGPEGTFNAFEFDKPVKTRIDYIFISKEGIGVLKHGVLSDSKDLRYPSDHFPVLAQLVFR